MNNGKYVTFAYMVANICNSVVLHLLIKVIIITPLLSLLVFLLQMV